MPNPQLKSKGLGIQFLGMLVLLAGTRGFFIFKGALINLYFPGLIFAVVVFAALLFWGGSLVKNSKG
jgi:hypothetical protein